MKNAVLSARPRQYWLVRWLLLGLILLAFARLVFRPDHKSLWWDESLSLQRAESSWRALVSGQIVLDDGLTAIATTDQHPFAYFVLLGSFIRLAGQSVMALRFPSAIAATLLAPMAWAFARLAARRRLLPQATPLWAALFTAVNPFYLWYGREARMYALVALLALLSTYLLLRWSAAEPGPRARRYLSGYGLAAVTLLSTHYLAVLVLPGGTDSSYKPFSPLQWSAMRMYPFSASIRARYGSAVAVRDVRYRVPRPSGTKCPSR